MLCLSGRFSISTRKLTHWIVRLITMAKKKIATEEVTPARQEPAKPKRHVKAKTLAVGSTMPPETMPLEYEIQLVAYLSSERRGFQGGSPEEDWLQAEQEVRQRRKASA